MTKNRSTNHPQSHTVERKLPNCSGASKGGAPAKVPVAGDHASNAADENDYLSNVEIDKLIVAAVAGSAPRPITEADIDPVIRWARNARIDQALLELVLCGHLVPAGMKEGELAFRLVGTFPPEEAARLQESLRKVDMAHSQRSQGQGKQSKGLSKAPGNRQPGTEV